MQRRVDIPQWLSLPATVHGTKNPVMVGPTETRWNTRTPDGPGALQLTRTTNTEVQAEAWGPGADWMLEQAPRLLGAEDDLTGFEPPSGPLADKWRANPFLLGRTDRLWDSLVGAVFGQKVQVKNAVKARRLLAATHGDPCLLYTSDAADE